MTRSEDPSSKFSGGWAETTYSNRTNHCFKTDLESWLLLFCNLSCATCQRQTKVGHAGLRFGQKRIYHYFSILFIKVSWIWFYLLSSGVQSLIKESIIILVKFNSVCKIIFQLAIFFLIHRLHIHLLLALLGPRNSVGEIMDNLEFDKRLGHVSQRPEEGDEWLPFLCWKEKKAEKTDCWS